MYVDRSLDIPASLLRNRHLKELGVIERDWMTCPSIFGVEFSCVTAFLIFPEVEIEAKEGFAFDLPAIAQFRIPDGFSLRSSSCFPLGDF
jgi:hypothetical protein